MGAHPELEAEQAHKMCIRDSSEMAWRREAAISWAGT